MRAVPVIGVGHALAGDGPFRCSNHSVQAVPAGVWPVADEPKTYTQAEYDALVQEKEALKANRDEALTEAKKAKAALKAWDGKDPAKYEELVKASEEAERKKAAAEGDFTTLKKQLVDAHAKELGERDGKIGKLTKALERRLVDAELTRAIAAKKGEPDLLLPYARQFVRVKETEDDYEGFVADERGHPLVADGKGTPMTFDVFVEERLMTKFPRAFEGTGSSGGGAAKSPVSGGGSKVIPAGDNSAFLGNLAEIATGKVKVG